ncbi:MAG: site-specific integrase [Evtepia gabavorous]
MFYLLFGQAYSRNYLDVDSYNKLCVNKDTKIHMPKLKTDDDLDIVAFSREELAILDDYFHDTNAETAYLLGRYCGLRINECFGLKWSNVDLENGTILIDRQMQYQESRIKLVSLKTRNAKRTIQMCDKLKVYFQELARRREYDQFHLADLREQNQRIIEDLDGSKIPSTELVNCLPDGKIQTVNSMKYPTREIKSKYGIMFKYHYLRHTYGTMMAEMNTPTHLLCNQMGHGNIQVTQRYYIALSRAGIEFCGKTSTGYNQQLLKRTGPEVTTSGPILSAFFNLVSRFNIFQELFHTLHHIGRIYNHCSFAETAYPRKKLVADFHIGGYYKMLFIILPVKYIGACAEAFNRSIKQRIDKANTDALFLSAEHGEHAAGITFHIQIGKRSCTLSRFINDLYFLHAVNTVCPHGLGLIIKCQQIIIALIYQQFIGADFIGGPFAALHLFALVLKCIFQIFEGDFLRCVWLSVLLGSHSRMDNANSQQNVVARCFHAGHKGTLLFAALPPGRYCKTR